MPIIEEAPHVEPRANKNLDIPEEEEFVPIGPWGKVDWKFVLTAATTDAEIYKKRPRMPHKHSYSG